MSGTPADAVINRAAYSVRTYMDRMDGRVYSDTHRFDLLRYCADDHFISDVQMHERRLTRFGGWAKRWQHWGRKGTSVSVAVGMRVDLAFVRNIEKRGNEGRLSELLEAYGADEVDTSKLSLLLVCYV